VKTYENVRLGEKMGEVEATKKEVLLDGVPTRVDSILCNGKEVFVTGSFLKTARLAEEWYEDVGDPESMLDAIRRSKVQTDIFSFWQRLPDSHPKYKYYMEWESIAAVSITSFDHWLKNSVNAKTRNMIRKADKIGVQVKEAKFDADFIKGMVEIFNEVPIRQGRPFWHYGKDAETVQKQFSRYLFREEIFGAYHDGTLIGFIFLAHADNYAYLGQILSKMQHRDKAPNNALIAKAVEVCAKKKIPYLIYANWAESSLVDFKRHNGFEMVNLPRYFVPLTPKGHLALKLHLTHGIVGVIPERAKRWLRNLRRKWHVIGSANKKYIH
jgi:hypothetical protein